MSATKIGESTTNILKLLSITIHLHFVKSKQKSTYRKLNLALTSSIYFVVLPLEMQNKTWTECTTCFLLCLKKKTNPQTFKSSSCKKTFLQCLMLYLYNLLRGMFFILCDTLEFRIDGTPRLLIIPFFPTLPNLIEYSPFVSFGEFCQPPLLFKTPFINSCAQSTAVAWSLGKAAKLFGVHVVSSTSHKIVFWLQ